MAYFVALVSMALVLSGCESFRLDSKTLPGVIPAGRNLYVLIEAKKDPGSWLLAAESFGLSPDLAGRVSQVCLFDIPPGGNLALLTGDFPLGLVIPVLASQGWTSSEGKWPWRVMSLGSQAIALLSDGALVASSRGTASLEWYADWQGSLGGKGLGTAEVLEGLEVSDFFDAKGYAPFVRVNSLLSAFNQSFHSLELVFESDKKILNLTMSLRFQQDLEERKAKSAARLFFLQTLQVLGIDPGLVTGSTLVQTGRSVSLSSLALAPDSLKKAFASLASQADIR